jgi:hypothetical protein
MFSGIQSPKTTVANKSIFFHPLKALKIAGHLMRGDPRNPPEKWEKSNKRTQLGTPKTDLLKLPLVSVSTENVASAEQKAIEDGGVWWMHQIFQLAVAFLFLRTD